MRANSHRTPVTPLVFLNMTWLVRVGDSGPRYSESETAHFSVGRFLSRHQIASIIG